MLQSLIFLTYKGKALLMNKKMDAIDAEKHPWCFIGGIKGEKESFENALTRRVEKEMGIKISNVTYLSKYCYHADLTDDDVNNIERSENQTLDFFSLRELKQLFVSTTTAQFMSQHSNLIEKSLQ